MEKDSKDVYQPTSLDHVEYGQSEPTGDINPLHGIPKAELINRVRSFCADHDLQEHVDVFIRGSLVAQHPENAQSIEELSDEERAMFNKASGNKWWQTKMMYFTVFICALGAATQGWDQTGSNGANLSFPQEFGISHPIGTPEGNRDEWILGVVNSAPYISSALLGVWLSDPLNKYFGRRGEIFITALILIATPIASGFTKSWEQLLATRLVMGIGMGAKAATVPMYAAELAPANIRGALVMGWQLWTAFGIFIGFAANAVVKDVGRIAWRLQLASCFIPAVPLAMLIYVCPESPRWLMKKGRYPQAYNAMKKLRHCDVMAAKDMYYAHVQLEMEAAVVQGRTYLSRFTELFTIPRVRRGTIAASTVMLAQQMCGINIIAFYSSSIFVESGYTSSQALYASLGFGAVNFLFAFPAVFTIDTFGRRSLLLATFPNMAWTLLAAGLMFLLDEDTVGRTTRVGLIALFIYLFAAFYSVGEGPVPFMYSAEVFPLAQREQGMAWAVAVCLGFASILGLTFPRMLRALTPTGAFGAYAVFNLIALGLIFLFVPETKQLTLEELDRVFEVPTSVQISHQVHHVVPAFFKRVLLRRKDAIAKPLVYQGTR